MKLSTLVISHYTSASTEIPENRKDGPVLPDAVVTVDVPEIRSTCLDLPFLDSAAYKSIQDLKRKATDEVAGSGGKGTEKSKGDPPNKKARLDSKAAEKKKRAQAKRKSL